SCTPCRTTRCRCRRLRPTRQPRQVLPRRQSRVKRPRQAQPPQRRPRIDRVHSVLTMRPGLSPAVLLSAPCQAAGDGPENRHNRPRLHDNPIARRSIAMNLTRRSVLRSSAIAFVAPAMGTALSMLGVTGPAAAQTRQWKHGLSLFGDLKYPEGFRQFDYVNPVAPQGGTGRQIAFGTFDNFNMVVAGVKGSLASGTELFTEKLLTPALDDVSAEYGLLVEAVSYPEDRSSVTYRLRANARWHDGKPVTPDDVVFSFNTFKTNSPFYGAYYRHVVKVEKGAEREITFTFDGPGNRELPQIIGQLPVLPKHWWEGTDKSGKKRDVTQTTL